MSSFKNFLDKNYANEETYLDLVKDNPFNLWKLLNSKHKTKISEKVKLEAVSKIGIVIEFIDNPSLKLQEAAIKQNPFSIVYIKNPKKSVVIEAIKKQPSLLQRKQLRYIEEKLPANYFQNLPYDIQKRLVDYAPGFVLLIPNLDKRLRNSLNVIRDKTGLI